MEPSVAVMCLAFVLVLMSASVWISLATMMSGRGGKIQFGKFFFFSPIATALAAVVLSFLGH